MKISTLAAAFAFGLVAAGAALADDAPKPAATPKPVAAAAPTPGSAMKPDPAAKVAKSADCYKQADVKGLHGKERKKFHYECMKAM